MTTTIVTTGVASESRATSHVFEWCLSGLHEHFSKSKNGGLYRLKSPLYGDGRWQLYMDLNIGKQDRYCGVFLVALPSHEENGGRSDATWSRRGKHSFRFEVRNLDKSGLYKKGKAAEGHEFSSVYYGDGTASFWSRDEAFHHNEAVRAEDGLVLICYLSSEYSSSPSTMAAQQFVPRDGQLMPPDLLGGLSALLDNEATSDLVFVVKPALPPGNGHRWRERRIHAAKALLASRSEYFHAMLTSGFAESHGLPEMNVQIMADSQEEDGGADVVRWDEYEFDVKDYETEVVPSTDALDPSHEHIGVPSADNDQATAKRRRAESGSVACDERPKTQVLITDASYSTLRALLKYLYTDRIAFYPLASGKSPSTLPCRPQDFLASANAIYAAADKMGLEALKKRAFDYITSNLTIANIAHQIFGDFVQLYPEFREIELAFILKHWSKIRDGPGLKVVMDNPDRYPGFSDVFGSILKAVVPAAPKEFRA